MSFSTALSGLNAATADLNVKSNNIANVNTSGFKQSRAEFGDVFAVSTFGSSSSTAIGSGVVLNNVAQQFNQGNLEFTDNGLDLAISGEGFFAMAPTQDSGEVTYTRAGAFGVNKDGFMVNSQGNFLRTFPVDAQGNISATSMSAAKPLQLPASQGEPESTTELNIATNLPSNAIAINDGTGVAFVGGSNTQSITSLDFSTPGTFDAGGTTVTLNANYANETALVNKVQADLGTGYTVTSSGTVGTSNFSITMTDNASNTAVVVNTLTGTANGITATAGTAGTAFVAPGVTSIDPFDSATYSNSTSATVFDSLGNEHIITTYYQKIDEAAIGGVDNQWQMEAYISAADIKTPLAGSLEGVAPNQLVRLGSSTTPGSTVVQFNSDGTLGAVNPDPIELDFTVSSGTELLSGAGDQTITLNLTGSTQNSGSFSVGALTVNGFPTGRLTGVDVSEDGLVNANYSNGQAVPIGKIAMARFANPQALNKIGNTAWKETTDSGPVIAGEAGTGSFGKLQSGALENSNVDLTKELVGLITAQRNFQANSKAIETNNAITQTIINIR